MKATGANIAIQLEQASFGFRLKGEGIHTFKDLVHSLGSRKIMSRKKVLEDISLEIYRGECFGLMGKNGSGKSTLLRLISGIIQPDKGKIKVNGTVAPILALGVGLEPELSGYENIRLLGTLQGIRGKAMEEAVRNIKDFSELSHADLKMQVKRYSTGMTARLAFSSAIANAPDILAIDEVLAVGDMGFQEKCYRRIDEIRHGGSTIIFVSHFIGEVYKICNRAALIDQGKVAAIGDVQEVGKAYEALFHQHPVS